MSTERNKARVRAYFEAIERGDRAALVALFDPEVRWRVPKGAIAPYGGMHRGAERIAEMILYPSTARFLGDAPQLRDLKRGLHEFGLEIEAVSVPVNGALTGATVGDAERRSNGSFFIVQIDRPGGQSFVHPGEEVKIEAEDTVVLVVRGSKVAAGAIFATPKQPVRVGRGFNAS